MPLIKILAERELREVVGLDRDIVDCIESAFATLAGGAVVMPPILSMGIPDFHGEVDVKTAYVPGVDSFAVKVSPGFFDNPKIGLPTTSGLMILFSSRTGVLEAVLLENGYLTDIRTAAAGAVAARCLSREDSANACILGAGAQAKLQLQALALVRPIRNATIWARDTDKSASAAEEMEKTMGIPVASVADPEAAVSSADIIVTTTAAKAPVLMADWMRSGQHITAMGSDQDDKNELDPGCFDKATLYVPDRLSQTEILGELRSAIEAGVVSPGAGFAELGDIVAGNVAGRNHPGDITICDLTGTGMQDTAIATLARERAIAAGAGLDFKT